MHRRRNREVEIFKINGISKIFYIENLTDKQIFYKKM